MRRRAVAIGAVLATIAGFVALDAVLSYVMWGIVFGMHDIEWFPLFPAWGIACALAALVAIALTPAHQRVVARTLIVCAICSVPYLFAAAALGVLACGDGGGCRFTPH